MLMPLALELVPALLGLFAVGLVAAALELRAALRPPECPECPHCRLAIAERRAREDEERDRAVKRLYGIDVRQEDDRHRPRR